MHVTDVLVAVRQSGDPDHAWLRLAPTDETTVNTRLFAYRTKEHGTGADRAQLVIDYTVPTATPTPTPIPPTGTPTPTPTLTPTPTPDIEPPVILITSPADDSQLGGTTVTVTGTVLDAHPITAITVNSAAATPGNWFAKEVSLSTGPNTLTVQATDSSGNVGTAAITVDRTQAPVLSAIESLTVALGQTLNITLAASDPDGDTLRFAVAPLPCLPMRPSIPTREPLPTRPRPMMPGWYAHSRSPCPMAS